MTCEGSGRDNTAPDDVLGLTLSEVRTSYVVSAMSNLTVVQAALEKSPEGNRITTRLESLASTSDVERQYRQTLTHSLNQVRDMQEVPVHPPDVLLAHEDSLRITEMATFAQYIDLRFRRRRMQRAVRHIAPIALGWSTPSIALNDAIEARTITRLHSERKILSSVVS